MSGGFAHALVMSVYGPLSVNCDLSMNVLSIFHCSCYKMVPHSRQRIYTSMHSRPKGIEGWISPMLMWINVLERKRIWVQSFSRPTNFIIHVVLGATIVYFLFEAYLFIWQRWQFAYWMPASMHISCQSAGWPWNYSFILLLVVQSESC